MGAGCRRRRRRRRWQGKPRRRKSRVRGQRSAQPLRAGLCCGRSGRSCGVQGGDKLCCVVRCSTRVWAISSSCCGARRRLSSGRVRFGEHRGVFRAAGVFANCRGLRRHHSSGGFSEQHVRVQEVAPLNEVLQCQQSGLALRCGGGAEGAAAIWQEQEDSSSGIQLLASLGATAATEENP